MVPEKFYRKLFYNSSFLLKKWSVIKDSFNNSEFGRNEITPLNAQMLIEIDKKKVSDRVNKVLTSWSVKAIPSHGLATVTSPLAQGGENLQDRRGI